MTRSPVRRVSEVLVGFENGFSEFARSFLEGDYVLWLGSGISREVVPNVADLLSRVLEMLRTHVDPANPACPHKAALEEALGLSNVSKDVINAVDFGAPVASWPARDDIVRQLSSKYSEVLDIPVLGQPNDYLVWSGLDVPNTYGDPAIEPDVEHYCIALLMLEGVVIRAVTANWDGLIERALAALTRAPDSVARVIVRSEDFRQGFRRTELIKFHGCAVRARENEDEYRGLLVARHQQISGWTEHAENRVMRSHLELLYTDHPSLVIGLSLQDANLHTMIARSIEDLKRPWPHTPPAVVLAEEELQPHHRYVLQATYRAAYETHAAEINDSALLGSYAKPTLLGLVLWTLGEKLMTVLECLPKKVSWGTAQVERIRDDLRDLRDVLGSQADLDNRVFVAQSIELVTLVLSVFRTGRAPDSIGANYEPLSDRPIRDALQNPDFPAAAFGRLAIAIALCARGHRTGDWTLLPGEVAAAEKGVVRLASTTREVRAFIVKDAPVAVMLTMDGLVDEDDVNTLIVVADREPPPSVRSSRSRYGRVGRLRACRVSIEELYSTAGSADELYESFKLAGGF